MIAPRHLIVFCCSSLLALYACRSTSKEVSDSFFKSAAYKSISDSIDRFPKDPELYVKRAQLLATQQLQDAAGADLEKAWQLSKDPTIAVEWTSNLIHRQQYAAADTLLSQLHRQYPREAIYLRQKAVLLEKTNRLKEALSIYQQLVMDAPNDVTILFEEGQLLLKSTDTASAILRFEKAYAIENDPFFGLALASLYEATHDPKTMACCNRLIHDFPQQVSQDARMLKGLYYAKELNYNAALHEFDQCIVQDYTFLDAHIEKGLIYMDMKQYAKALDVFTRAGAISSSSAEIAYWMGRCNELMKDTAAAINAYQRCLAIDPSYKEAKERLTAIK